MAIPKEALPHPYFAADDLGARRHAVEVWVLRVVGSRDPCHMGAVRSGVYNDAEGAALVIDIDGKVDGVHRAEGAILALLGIAGQRLKVCQEAFGYVCGWVRWSLDSEVPESQERDRQKRVLRLHP